MRTRTRAIGKRAGRGFTLIELLVVLAILVGLSAALPLAWQRLSPQRQLAVCASRLRSDLGLLRAQAMRGNVVATLSIAADGSGYSISARSFSRELPGSVRLQLLPGASLAPAQTLRFFPDGSSSGGLLRLSRDGRVADLRVGALGGSFGQE